MKSTNDIILNKTEDESLEKAKKVVAELRQFTMNQAVDFKGQCIAMGYLAAANLVEREFGLKKALPILTSEIHSIYYLNV